MKKEIKFAVSLAYLARALTPLVLCRVGIEERPTVLTVAPPRNNR
ncbi:MAG: hypothetical protein ACYTFI_14795 [Planctomycetota bacterium]|jgi:hypothetical protein